MKEFSIGNINIKNRYVQAPLAGYTTFAMREMARRYGCGLAYTEMTSCSALNYENNKTIEMLPRQKEDGLLALQIFGGDPFSCIKAVQYLESQDLFYDFLDFNFGCPVHKVIKQGAGSSFLQREDEMYQMMREIVKLSSRPVIAKIRLGFKDFNYLSVSKLLENAGVQALAVHGRLQKEGFTGIVHYDKIAEIKQQLSIPVIANGNINLDNFQEVLDITKADALMFGREAIGYPKLFKDLIDIETGLPLTPKNKEDQIKDLLTHLQLLVQEKGEECACSLMRGIGCFYLKGMDDSKELKQTIVHLSTYQEYEDLLLPLIKKRIVL